STGEVTFKAAPNFEAPADADGNNVYDIVVTASDGTLSTDRTVAITVTDVSETSVINGTPGNDVLNGSSGADIMNGLAGNDVLNGLAGNDDLTGGTGNDILDGGVGDDAMHGGAGDDIYVVDSSKDTVDDAVSNSGGTDTVQSAVSFSLVNSAHVLGTLENLTLTSTGDVNATGNAENNVLVGNSGANVLDGGAGADIMRGGAGNDTYVVDSAKDTVDESVAGSSGTDTVQSSVSFSLVTSAHVLGVFENLTLTGTGKISGTGNTADNVLIGNSGNNQLDGGAGNDTLTGGLGADTFLFTTALSSLTNVDVITDFDVSADTIGLDRSIFTAAGHNGTLAADAFHIGTAAADASDRIIYNSATGALIYDSNGSAVGGVIQFATLSTGLALTNADFAIG
ncbi:MAG: calcium-binding protein, partial [Mesorhizobium sp.]